MVTSMYSDFKRSKKRFPVFPCGTQFTGAPCGTGRPAFYQPGRPPSFLPLIQFLHGVFTGVGDFTGAGVFTGVSVGTFVGVFMGVGVGILVVVFVAGEESDDLDPSSPGIERHPADRRQAASSRAVSMNRVDFCMEGVFSPDLLIDSENVSARMNGRPEYEKISLN
jgi:hypothetical protein